MHRLHFKIERTNNNTKHNCIIKRRRKNKTLQKTLIELFHSSSNQHTHTRGELIEPDDLPPQPAHDAPDEHVHDAHDAAQPQRVRHADVPRSEVQRPLAAGVVRNGAKQVGVERHGQARQHGGRAGGDHHGHEGGGQRGHLRRLGGEQVVDDVVHGVQQHEDGLPPEVHGGERPRHAVAEERDEAQRVELRAHADEHGKPQQGVPRPLLLQAVLPADDSRDELQRHAEHGGSDRGHANGVAEDPQNHGQPHGGQHQRLVLRQRTHLLELGRSLLGGVGGVLDLRREQLEHDVRGHRQPHDGGHARRLEPHEPGRHDDHAEGGGELERQQVLGRRRHAHGGGVPAGLQLRLDEVGADLVGRGAGLGPRVLGQTLDDGEVHAAGARGGGGHGGGQQRLGNGEAVGQAQGGLAQDLHEEGGHAVAQAGLHEALGEEEGEDDEPDDLVGHGAERLLEGEGLGDHGDGQAAESPGAHGQRGEHQARHRGQEDGQQAPRLGEHAGGARDHEVHKQAEGDGHGCRLEVGTLPLEPAAGCGRCGGGGGGHPDAHAIRAALGVGGGGAEEGARGGSAGGAS
mmetsp:Transcript_23548/g.57688  ORF Transcript_23548/g.57688 Transcript_23548/m.57688 type:complete len:572 (+) Transcript_23548:67-1782(+)